MIYICFTACETGFRSFSPIMGAAISYDRNYIKWLIEQEKTKTEAMKAHAELTEQQVQEMKAHQSLPAIVDYALEKQRSIVCDQIVWQRRLETAEAVVNGQLMRSIVYVEDLKEAIAYSTGLQS